MTQQLSNEPRLENTDAARGKGQEIRQGPGPMKVIETPSGFIIQNPASGASPPANPDRVSRAVNSGCSG